MARRLPSVMLLVVTLAILFVVFAGGALMPVRAGDPGDNRINRSPWVNSFGAIAVYCVDASGKAGGSFAGGGVVILSSSGQRVLFAPEAALNNASARASR